MSERIEWEGTEAQQQQERMKACRERCAQWGEPDEGDDCDGDGSCAECEMDMAEALETEESRARRRASRAAASAPAGDGDAIEAAARAMCDRVNGIGDYDENIEQRRPGWTAQAKAALDAAALARPRAAVGEQTIPLYTFEEAWDELVNVDDRTSPEEYPDMCLITREELRTFMQGAVGQAIERHVRDALNDSEELADGSVNITADHARRLNAEVDAWEGAALARPRVAVGDSK